jgi:hypothetical protein
LGQTKSKGNHPEYDIRCSLCSCHEVDEVDIRQGWVAHFAEESEKISGRPVFWGDAYIASNPFGIAWWVAVSSFFV